MEIQPEYLIASGVCVLIAIGLVLWGRSYLLVARRIEESQVTPVASVAPGFVEVKGRVKAAGSLLRSPMTGKPCVYYRFVVKEKVNRGKSTSWRIRVDDEKECGVVLEDVHQGQIAVEVLEANLMLKPDARTTSGVLNDAPPELEAALRRYGGSSQGIIFNKSMQYDETILEVGDELHVLGTARMKEGKMVIGPGGRDLFIVSDQPEEQLVRWFQGRKVIRYILAGAVAALGAGLLALAMAGSALA